MLSLGQTPKEPIKYTSLFARPCANSVLSVDRASLRSIHCKENAMCAYALAHKNNQRKEKILYSIGEDRE